MRALAAPDKLRGSLDARSAARALAAGAAAAGWSCAELPLADGGEGTLDALGGANRSTEVSGPLEDAVSAVWRLAEGIAVVESALASGLALAGGASRNDPVAASSRGTGELIAAAIDAGAERVIVGVGGSASTDGGLGAVEALDARRLPVPVLVACDVRTRFTDAARLFGPQKGATATQVELLTGRLHALAERYRGELGIEIAELPGSGAAGGLAGGLAALGAELVPGFELVAEHAGFELMLDGAAAAVTAEGRLDESSFDGKVVGGVLDACRRRGIPLLVVCGEIARGTACSAPVISLVERFGRDRAFAEPEACLAEAAAEGLAAL